MYKYEAGTPCPRPIASNINLGDIFSPPKRSATESKQNPGAFDGIFDAYNDNTTLNIQNVMREEFRNAEPKKRTGLDQKARKGAIGVFEDRNISQGGGQSIGVNQSQLLGGGAIRARGPRKIKLETAKEDRSFGASAQCEGTKETNHGVGLESMHLEFTEPARESTLGHTGPARQDDLEKNRRRRMIWVPDDTTVFTIHPGAHTHTLSDETMYAPAQKPAPRQSSLSSTSKGEPSRPIETTGHRLSVAPKRAPLQSLPPVHSNVSVGDRIKGTATGKENVLPFAELSKPGSEKSVIKPAPKSISQMVQSGCKAPLQNRTALLRQKAAALKLKDMESKKRRSTDPKDGSRKAAKVAQLQDAKVAHISSPHAPVQRSMPSTLTKSTVRPNVSANLSRYPVLSEDLAQPELYEENWLTHQEVALTQLINGVFQQAEPPASVATDNVTHLRSELLRMYQDSEFVMLHKRIRASLLFGALSMPKEATNLPRLKEDVGIRRQFLDLWVQSYDLNMLQAAAEVIIGRAMTAVPRNANSVLQSLGSSSSAASSAKEKELRRFLLTFLVHHEDMVDINSQHIKHTPAANDDKAPKIGTPEWLWQRTLLHSLMLVALLDKAKVEGVVSGNVFQTASIRKSSTSVLHALARMMMPSAGDIIRPLGYLGYVVPHVQHPIDEYTYRIGNIATDLRNGVLLTRFVELLVYNPSAVQALKDQTVTLSMPEGETLTSIVVPNQDDAWVLSQHLKFPSAGRAQKLYNVQIALAALQSLPRSPLTEAAISSTSAEDIVDGHREKTLSLLWSLVSRWAMGLLVDWPELKRETLRFRQQLGDNRLLASEFLADGENGHPNPGDAEQAALLKAWAAALCAPHGISISNLTTSFASGLALDAIVASYAPFLPKPKPSAASTHNTSSTASTLRALGCSKSFTALFAHSTLLPSRQTTLALLAYLASRLLPLARTHRAATTLQRALRLHLARRRLRQRVLLARLAADCAFVVNVQRGLVHAARVVQRAWRRVLERRRERQRTWVTALQALARGWKVRDVSGRAGMGKAVRRAGTVRGRRIMGGW